MPKLNEHDIASLPARFPQLTDLSIDAHGHAKAHSIEALKALPLTALHLFGAKDPAVPKSLLSLQLGLLRNLSLEFSLKFSEAKAQKLCAGLVNLETLALSDTHNYRRIPPILNHLHLLRSLRSLQTDTTQIPVASVLRIPSLHKLFVDRFSDLTSASLITLAQSLPLLRSFAFNRPRIDDFSVDSLVAVARLRYLEGLRLCAQADASNIIKAAAQHDGLQSLWTLRNPQELALQQANVNTRTKKEISGWFW